MQIFKRMGYASDWRELPETPSDLQSRRPRVILIEQFGLLVGLITVKDCLKYTLAHEAQTGQETSAAGSEELEQTLEDLRAWFGEMWDGIVDRIKGRDPQRGGGPVYSLPSDDEGTDLDEVGGRPR